MADQVSEEVKAQRSARMISLGERKRRIFESGFVGKEVEVLVEEEAEVNGRTVQTGYTREYMKIALESEKNLKNCIVNVQIDNDSQIIH